MQLSISRERDVDIFAPHGSVHAGDDITFGEALTSLRREGRFLLVIDARDLEYINSRAIGQLVQFSRDARLAGGRVVLVSPAPAVAKILKAVGLLSLIPICDSIKSAVSACAAKKS